MFDVVTAGETMILAVPSTPKRLRHAASLELKIGGAESNLAIALSRLGLSASWISALDTDEPGQLVLDRIRGEGVDTSQVRRPKDSFTGLYMRDYLGTRTRAYYYRKDSAASRLSPGAFAPDCLRGTSFLHLTGITPALSASCREFTRWAIQAAGENGVRVSFDVNYRSKLWSAKEAASFLEEVLPKVDVIFASHEESLALWGNDHEKVLRRLSEPGSTEVILKHGARGSSMLFEGKVFEQKAFPVPEVDPVGAGDAFAAGYLAGSLWKLAPQERLRVASALGALSVSTLGDYEGLPMREELEDFLDGKNDLGR